jgi:ATP-binding cassette subfamily B protein
MGRDLPAVSTWLEATASSLRLEANLLRVRFADLQSTLAGASPALIWLGPDAEPKVLAVLSWRTRYVELLGPDGRRRTLPASAVIDLLAQSLDGDAVRSVDALLSRAALDASRRGLAHQGMLRRVLAHRMVDAGWSIALPPNAPFASQLRQAGVGRSVITILSMQVAKQCLGLLGWWLIGRGALHGQLEPAWLIAWGLAALSTIPPSIVGGWTRGTTALQVGLLLKRRLLHGALRLEPEEVRHQGSGQMLGQVIESSALESLASAGGLAALVALADVVLTSWVLSLAPGAALPVVTFLAFLLVLLCTAWAASTRMVEWTRTRLQMTRDLIERMVGHRTRLVQERQEQWHESEDEVLERYAERSAELDRITTWLEGSFPRAWMIFGVAAIAPGFAKGALVGSDLALAIGGILMGYGALESVTGGVVSLIRARVAWLEVRSLFRAGAREERQGAPQWTVADPMTAGDVVLEARDLHFRYADRPQAVLRGVDLRITREDRILLQGPSGGGKSTLASIVTGLRAPGSGLLLLGGLDRATLGEAGWRRRAVAVPQFHENHLVGAPLAFNVLMGRGWPPHEADLAEAEQVCVELGLGPLLERMPSGIMQMVGETGWQLSHGERSRVFIARALVQRPDLLVLDESFSSLDPGTLERALECVRRRSRALVVIAHP